MYILCKFHNYKNNANQKIQARLTVTTILLNSNLNYKGVSNLSKKFSYFWLTLQSQNHCGNSNYMKK